MKALDENDVVKEEEITTEPSDINHADDDVNSELEAAQEELEDQRTKDDTEVFKSKLAEKDKEIQDYINQLQRLQADFLNFKKRTEKEKSEIFLLANEKMAAELLGIIDNLERALAAQEDNTEGNSLYLGIELVYKQLVDTLNKHGIEEIDALNKPFDANFHHAVMQEENGAEENLVIEVYQKGYTINGRVLRPSMVKVSK